MVILGFCAGWLAQKTLSETPSIPTSNFEHSESEFSMLGSPPKEPTDHSAQLWSDLALSMAARAYALEDALKALQEPGGDPRSAIQEAIAQASDPEIAAVVSAVTQIDEDQLLASGDLRPFANRLVDVALDGLDAPSREPSPSQAVYFAETTRDFDPLRSSQSLFPSDQGRIFAFVEIDDPQAQQLMVKWRNKGTRRIHNLQSVPHRPGKPTWSFLKRAGPWDPGEYEVSFYTHDARMLLLARGTFTVASPTLDR